MLCIDWLRGAQGKQSKLSFDIILIFDLIARIFWHSLTQTAPAGTLKACEQFFNVIISSR
jgi:hypothetical protein